MIDICLFKKESKKNINNAFLSNEKNFILKKLIAIMTTLKLILIFFLMLIEHTS